MGDNLHHAHGTVMILAWMVFGSTGILFGRYGRVLRFGNRRQFLGKSLWFQIHRFFLSLSSLLTLMGFFFIIVHRRGQWINPTVSGTTLYAHSISGSIVVSCIVLQIWLALYRCHPHSRFRFMFNWTHRITGFFAFIFALNNLFLITFVLPNQHIALVIIVSLWASWILLVTILFELIQYQYRKAAALIALNTRISNANQEAVNTNVLPDTEAGTNPTVDNVRLNQIKLILLIIHIIISIVLCAPLIFIVWHET